MTLIYQGILAKKSNFRSLYKPVAPPGEGRGGCEPPSK